jgi:hypothetical protein
MFFLVCVFISGSFFLIYIAFAFLAFTAIALFVKAVTVARAVVLIIFTVYIKGFRRLLRLIGKA